MHSVTTGDLKGIVIVGFFAFTLPQAQAVRESNLSFEINGTAATMTGIGKSKVDEIGGNIGDTYPNDDHPYQLVWLTDFAGISPYEEETSVVEPALRLCGYPLFMDQRNCNSNSSISSCMNNGKAISYGAVILLIGVSIIAVNVLIPVLVFANKSLRTQHYYIKASLAVADSIVGFILTFSVLPNIVWVTGISAEALEFFPEKDKNSVRAVTVGAFLTVSITASLLHLAYLSFERFTAIKWPFRHMRRKTRSIIITIACLWIISLAASFVPAAFPNYFAYQFQPTLLIHTMTIQQVNGTMSEWRGVLYGTVTVIIPYTVMSVLCVMTAMETHRKRKKSKKALGEHHKPGRFTSTANRGSSAKSQSTKKKDPEISVFFTVGLMIIAFTLTLLPFAIVVILFLAGFLDCENYTIPYVSLFYVGLLNSLANGMIYSVRDERFRCAVKRMFPCSKSSSNTGSVNTRSQTLLTQH